MSTVAWANLPFKSRYRLISLNFLGCELEESEELLDLTKRIQLKRLSKQNPQKIINRLFAKVDRHIHSGRMRAWEKTVELLAKWLVLHEELPLSKICCKSFEGLDLKPTKLYLELETLLNIYVAAARRNPWDHIGELYTEQGLVGPGQNMTPKGVVDMMIQMNYAGVTDKQLITQLDPCVGTGRFLWESSILNPKLPLVLFGIEICLPLYRGCLVNMTLFSKHPYSIVCGNTLMLDPKLTGPSSPMWDYGNRWQPPDISRFYWKPPPISRDSFSLKAFKELNPDFKT